MAGLRAGERNLTEIQEEPGGSCGLGWVLGQRRHLKSGSIRGFPGGPVAKILRSQCRGSGFDPWSGN